MCCTLNIWFSLWGSLVGFSQCKNMHPAADQANQPPLCQAEHKQLAARCSCRECWGARLAAPSPADCPELRCCSQCKLRLVPRQSGSVLPRLSTRCSWPLYAAIMVLVSNQGRCLLDSSLIIDCPPQAKLNNPRHGLEASSMNSISLQGQRPVIFGKQVIILH